jgi:outer membrane receptor protein involved in Fe transport
MRKISLLIFLSLLIHYLPLYAGTTGKIAGQITDEDNGQALPGVNVYLEGTGLGAATDPDGFFYIINVPAGNYTVVVNYVGYGEQKISDVKVQIDLTTTIDVSLKSELLQTDAVVVTAKRPVVTKDISNSQLNIEIESIETLPIQTIDEAMTLQAGIEAGSRGIIIRGGGANQTVFMVDGFSQNDERSNYPYSAVSLSSIEEVQIQTGGFNAEYGQARSGIVNVITREGGRQKYSGQATVRYAPAASKSFGPSLYDPYSFFNRPYQDPDVMWTGTNNGAWDEYTQSQYPFFQGWNAVSAETLSDEDPTNDLTPDGAMRLYQWQHRRQGDIKEPDYIIDLGFGGPFPFVSESLGDLRFFMSYFKEQEMFVFPLSSDHFRDEYFQLKLTSDISPSMKLMFSGLYGEVQSVSPYTWTTTPTGYLLRGTSTVANYASSNTVLYMPGYYSPGSILRKMIGVKFTHLLSQTTFYEAAIHFKDSRHDVYQMEDRDLARVYEPVPGYNVDEAPWGYYGYSVNNPIPGMDLGGWMNLGRDKSQNSTLDVNFDITTALDRRNQLKAGFIFTYNDFGIVSGTFSPSMSTWTRSMIYDVYPYRLGAYVQDKLEFEGFIANLGVRLDYTYANNEVYDLEPFDDFFKAGNGQNIEEEAPTKPAESYWSISPRLGISHPITENSKLYFNYGHFRAEPFSSYRFRLQRESNGLVTDIGNPNMILEKTVAYELGYEHSIADMFLIKLAGYYKDVTDQPGWIYFQDLTGDVQYNRAENNNYADIRGFELTLTKRTGPWVTGFINYTYDVRSSGYFGLREIYQDPNRQRLYLEQNPYQERVHPRPFAKLNLSFFTPDEYGPNWGSIYPLDNWNFNFLGIWRTGEYETYNPHEIPGIVDNVQWRDFYNVDLRISKLLYIGSVGVQLYVDILNVFNFKHMDYAGFSSYRDDYLPYLESLNFSWESGEEHGDDKIGDYRPYDVPYDPLEPNPDNDPAIKARNDVRKENNSYIDNPDIQAITFLNPRRYIFGLKVNF